MNRLAVLTLFIPFFLFCGLCGTTDGEDSSSYVQHPLVGEDAPDYSGDSEGLNQAIAKCEEFKAIQEGDGFTLYIESRGKSGNDCEIFIQLQSIDKSEIPKELAVAIGFLGIEGSSMVCMLSDEQIALLNDQGEESIEFIMQDCHGPLKDHMEFLLSFQQP
ncbi:hypothetical protein KAW38_01475 [Candidatus Micrarchaeota archaeon]|nr:hypothetical protein [Candidatus Micrarchaeota archaeon]